jgi:phosphohistidine phosphatase
MKTILVMRHAKAETESPTDNDFDRRLKKKGIVAAQYISESLSDIRIVPDIIITSPVIRALSTAHILAEHFGLQQKMLIKNYLYSRLYTFKEIVEDIISFQNESDTVIIIGHNPGISYLLQQIDSKSNDVLTTSSAVVFDFEATNWSELHTAKCVRRCRIDKEK